MIDSFRGKYRFLSNFYILEYPIFWRGINYPSSEHFYQAMKTTDHDERLLISQAKSPGIAKKMCSPEGYKGFKIKLRDNWDIIKDPVMSIGVLIKFTMNIGLGNMLINTHGQVLIEGNKWCDNYWGDCQCVKCVKHPGLNKLGRILMNTRDQIINIG